MYVLVWIDLFCGDRLPEQNSKIWNRSKERNVSDPHENVRRTFALWSRSTATEHTIITENDTKKHVASVSMFG